MTNKLSTLIASSAIGLSLAAMSAFGAEFTPVHVNVPFAFTAGKTAMPAGEYTVSETDSHIVLIRGAKTSIMVLATPGTETDSETSALGFERSSKGFVLRSVRAVGQPSSVLPARLGEK